MRAVIDANILIFANHLRIWDELFAFLDRCDLKLILIESVYQQEIPDHLRDIVDSMIEKECLALVKDPDKAVQKPKDVRKLQRKIARQAKRCPPTSRIDRQLLLVALRDDIALLTDEGPLRHLAGLCNAPLYYDLLDAIEALFAGNIIDSGVKETLLSKNPGGRHQSAEDLETILVDRGGRERFACTEATDAKD